MKTKEIILASLGIRLKNLFNKLPENEFENIQEIRLWVNQPIMISKSGELLFITERGLITKNIEQAFSIYQRDLSDTLQMMSDYSLYAFEEEIRNGYITLQGGHRVGLVGKIIMENGHLKTMRYIGGMNIRISHQIVGCADKVLPYLINHRSIYHTLIISPPRCGKTTLLRDLIRQISNGISKDFTEVTVGIVDERSEIAGCYRYSQNDIGKRSDVLDCCPKVDGAKMLLRSMSPDVCGGWDRKIKDIYNRDVMNAGESFFRTGHGSSLSIFKENLYLKNLCQHLNEWLY